MARREKPIARRVPISRVREATIRYMVFMAANTAPIAHDHGDEAAQGLDGVGHGPGLVLVVLLLGDRAAASMFGWTRIQRSRAAICAGSATRKTTRVGARCRAGRRRGSVSKSPQTSLSKAAPSDSKTPTMRRDWRRYRSVPPSSRPRTRLQDPAPHHHLFEARREEPARDHVDPGAHPEGLRRDGRGARRSCASRRTSCGRAMTDTHSQETRGRPSGPRDELRPGRGSRCGPRARRRRSPRSSSPRLTTIALSGGRVPRSAARKPWDMAMSTANTATTSAMPTMASSRDRPARRARCARCRRGEGHL